MAVRVVACRSSRRRCIGNVGTYLIPRSVKLSIVIFNVWGAPSTYHILTEQ